MRAHTGGRSRLAVFLPSLAVGGAQRVMLNLAAGFADRGIATDLVLASAGGPYLAHVPPTLRVVDLKVTRVLRSLYPLTAYLRRERPSALLAGQNHANLVAMAAARASGGRTRVVISIHATMKRAMREERSRLRRQVVPRLLGLLHPLADAIVAVSEGVADDVSNFIRIPRERFEVIYNAVVTPALLGSALEPAPHPWFQNADCPVVLGVGRLRVQKNFPALVEAFALVNREQTARLVILGEGPERPVIMEHIRRHRLEDRVALPGCVNNPYACMSRAAVLALSSDWEGLPTVLIESLAVGTPVVSTDCPSGPREILRDGALGRLVPVGDVRALAGAILSTLRAPRLAPPLEALRPFTPDVVLDRYHRVFNLYA